MSACVQPLISLLIVISLAVKINFHFVQKSKILERSQQFTEIRVLQEDDYSSCPCGHNTFIQIGCVLYVSISNAFVSIQCTLGRCIRSCVFFTCIENIDKEGSFDYIRNNNSYDLYYIGCSIKLLRLLAIVYLLLNQE